MPMILNPSYLRSFLRTQPTFSALVAAGFAFGISLVLTLSAYSQEQPPKSATFRIPFPVLEKTPVEQDDEESDAHENGEELTEPPHLDSEDSEIRQTSTHRKSAGGYVPDVTKIAPAVPAKSELRPRYQVSHPESVGKKENKTSVKETVKKTLPQLPPPPIPPREEDALPSSPITSSPVIAAPIVLPAVKTVSETETINVPAPAKQSVNNNVSNDAVNTANCSLPDDASCGGYKTEQEFFFDGWAAAGMFMNTHHPKGRDNSPMYYNDRNEDVLLNQVYLSFGRNVQSKQRKVNFGGRIDLLYGTDYFYTSALGLETEQVEYLFKQPTLDPLEAVLKWNPNNGDRRSGTVSLYGLSMPQVYGEAYIPFIQGLTVKAGHFYSGMGVESAMSPQNFFYSHSYNFMFGNPTTLTGAVADLRLNKRLSLTAGLTQGWNIFDKPTNNVSVLAGFDFERLDKKSALSFRLYSGEESLREGDNRTSYTLTYRRQLSPDWLYAIEHSFGTERNGALLNTWTGKRATARWTSFAQYLQWKYSETVSLGARLEWFRDDGYSRVLKSPVADPGYRELTGRDFYELTLGANWRPTNYITVRPEVRYDWSNVKINGQQGIYSNSTKRNMVSFAIDGVVRF
jgi:hypothetical protein